LHEFPWVGILARSDPLFTKKLAISSRGKPHDDNLQSLFQMPLDMKDGGDRNLYACKAPHCQVGGVIFCDKCLKELNPNKGLFGSGLPKKCPTCGVGELATVRWVEWD